MPYTSIDTGEGSTGGIRAAPEGYPVHATFHVLVDDPANERLSPPWYDELWLSAGRLLSAKRSAPSPARTARRGPTYPGIERGASALLLLEALAIGL